MLRSTASGNCRPRSPNYAGRSKLATGCRREPDGPEPQFVLGGHKGQVNAITAFPEGRRLLSASHDGAIRIWDLANGRETAALDWTIGPITALAFAPDGLTCAAAGAKGRVVLWDVGD